jgi:3-oxoadipate enol-lactonase/4-carboxymuconolactone decarboxylase
VITRLALTDLGGSGPTLLLGPSLGTTAQHLWGAAAGPLSERYHVLAWDLPGHGESPPAGEFTIDDLAAAVLDLLDGPFSYAGVSLGGAVGLQLLLRAPSRVSAAVLLSTGARIGRPDAWAQRAERVRREGAGWLVAESPSRWFAPAHRGDDTARTLLADLAETEPGSYAAACDALAGFDVRARLADIGAPVLAIAGAHDPPTPPASLRHIADGVQHGRLAIIDDASHQSPAEAPDAVAALITDFPGGSPATTSVERTRADGMRVRREVLGDAHVEVASVNADEFTGEFQRFITGYAWGSIWTRPGLDRRSRSLITVTALVARGHHDELAMHLRAALRNGVTQDEIKEVLLHSAIYCGVPDANTAFRIAAQVIAEERT